MQTNIKSFILQCILSAALWRLLITGFLWIDITNELFLYILLAVCFGMTHYFFHCIKKENKMGVLYWWILLGIIFRVITIPLGYIAITTAAQGVVLLWVTFILGIPFAVLITNKLFKIIKMIVS